MSNLVFEEDKNDTLDIDKLEQKLSNEKEGQTLLMFENTRDFNTTPLNQK